MAEKRVKVSEMAKELGCSDQTIRRMLKRNEIPGVKVGRDWRLQPEKVVIALSNRK